MVYLRNHTSLQCQVAFWILVLLQSTVTFLMSWEFVSGFKSHWMEKGGHSASWWGSFAGIPKTQLTLVGSERGWIMVRAKGLDGSQNRAPRWPCFIWQTCTPVGSWTSLRENSCPDIPANVFMNPLCLLKSQVTSGKRSFASWTPHLPYPMLPRVNPPK